MLNPQGCTKWKTQSPKNVVINTSSKQARWKIQRGNVLQTSQLGMCVEKSNRQLLWVIKATKQHAKLKHSTAKIITTVYEYKQIFRHGFPFKLLAFSHAFIAQQDKVQIRATMIEGNGQVILKTVKEITCQIFRGPQWVILEVRSRRAEGKLVICCKKQ